MLLQLCIANRVKKWPRCFVSVFIIHRSSAGIAIVAINEVIDIFFLITVIIAIGRLPPSSNHHQDVIEHDTTELYKGSSS